MIRPPRADRVSLRVPQSASIPTQGEATQPQGQGREYPTPGQSRFQCGRSWRILLFPAALAVRDTLASQPWLLLGPIS